jgi:hypothetical protein
MTSIGKSPAPEITGSSAFADDDSLGLPAHRLSFLVIIRVFSLSSSAKADDPVTAILNAITGSPGQAGR